MSGTNPGPQPTDAGGPAIFDEVCTGMDVPTDPWTAEDVRFWTGTATYQPWKDVAAFFREISADVR